MSRTSTCRSGAFQTHVAMQFLGAQRSGAGMQRDAGIGGNQNFIIHASRIGVGAGQQVRLNIHPVSALIVIDLNFVGVQNRVHDDHIVQRRLDRNRAVRIHHRYARFRSHREVVFLLALGHQRARHDHANRHQLCRAFAYHIRSQDYSRPRSSLDQVPQLWPHIGKGLFK